MEAMTSTTAVNLDAIIHAAGMTCFAEDCDLIVMRPSAARVVHPFVAASEVSPPFAGD